MVKEITEGNFEEVVLQSKQPVVIDFWAQWCGPCRVVGSIVEEIQNDFGGKIVVGKVDVDKNPELATRYGVMGVPSVLFFKDGQIADKLKGAAPKKDFQRRLEKLI